MLVWVTSWNITIAFLDIVWCWYIFLSIVRVAFVLPSLGAVVWWKIIWCGGWSLVSALAGCTFLRITCRDWLLLSKVSIRVLSMMSVHNGWNVPGITHLSFVFAFSSEMLLRVTFRNWLFLSIVRITLVLPSLGSIVRWKVIWGCGRGFIGTLASCTLLRIAGWDWFLLGKVSIGILSVVGIHYGWDIPSVTHFSLICAFSSEVLLRVTFWDRFFLSIVGIAFVLPSFSTVIRWKVIRGCGRSLVSALSSCTLLRIAGWDRFLLSKVSVWILSVVGVHNGWNVPGITHLSFVFAFSCEVLLRITFRNWLLLSIVRISLVLPSLGSIIRWKIIWSGGRGLVGAFTSSALLRIACWDRLLLSKVTIRILSVVSVHYGWDIPCVTHFSFVSAFTCEVLLRITFWDRFFLSIVRVTFVLPSLGSIIRWEIIRGCGRGLVSAFASCTFLRIASWDWLHLVVLLMLLMMMFFLFNLDLSILNWGTVSILIDFNALGYGESSNYWNWFLKHI